MTSKSNTINDSRPLLEVKYLKTYFPVYGGVLSKLKGFVHAVDDVSIDVYKGKTLGLVGESGCGKSTLAHSIMRTVIPTSGSITFEGEDILAYNKSQLRKLRKDLQLIFQDPFSSLDPRMTIGEIVGEPLFAHGIRDKDELKKRVIEILNLVEISPSYVDRYPHEFSGGQRQRVSIARSLVLKPKLIICDEPVSALDVSIQSQILNLLNSVQDELDLTYIFISHALNVVRHVSDTICVMYLGKVMEIASAADLFENAKHPYTEALLSAIPIPDPTVKRDRIILKGDIPSPQNPPSGCRFHTRCIYTEKICIEEEPVLQDLGNGSFSACHFCEEFRTKKENMNE